MAGFEKFGDYMFSLLFTPLRKGKQTANQFYIFCKVVGKLFDDSKRDIFRVRAESMVISASEPILAEHGKDRGMTRLKGEDVETYRTRLSMKAIIAEKAGTREGVLLALKSIGYENSYIEPLYKTDTAKWAEFIVFLRGKNPSGVNDIDIIHAEVMKVKEASSKPFYGIEEYTTVEIRAMSKAGLYKYPISGRNRCGQIPFKNNNVGYLMASSITAEVNYKEGSFPYLLSGTMRASEKPYHKADIIEGLLLDTNTSIESTYREGSFQYSRSGQLRAGQKK